MTTAAQGSLQLHFSKVRDVEVSICLSHSAPGRYHGEDQGNAHLAGAGDAGAGKMADHHVRQPGGAAEDAAAGVLQQRFHVLPVRRRLEVHAELAEHGPHSRLRLAQHLAVDLVQRVQDELRRSASQGHESRPRVPLLCQAASCRAGHDKM